MAVTSVPQPSSWLTLCWPGVVLLLLETLLFCSIECPWIRQVYGILAFYLFWGTGKGTNATVQVWESKDNLWSLLSSATMAGDLTRPFTCWSISQSNYPVILFIHFSLPWDSLPFSAPASFPPKSPQRGSKTKQNSVAVKIFIIPRERRNRHQIPKLDS